MTESPAPRSRPYSLIFLGISTLLLMAGLTVLKPYLHEKAFIIYWITCFAFNGLTLLTALLDFRAIRRNTKKEYKHLVEDTLLDKFPEKPQPPPSDNNRDSK